MLKKLLLLFSLVFLGLTSHSQILISIILGDKLNSPNLEFGVDGGLNLSYITGLESKTPALNLNLGFYFDIRIKNNWWLNTGLMMKSDEGANDLTENDVLAINPEFKQHADSGTYSQSYGFLNVPLLIKYRFKNHIFVETGAQIGLMTVAKLNHTFEKGDKSITTTWKNRNSFNNVDIGFVVGFGYKLLDGEGMNFGFKYYLGMVDMTKSVAQKNYNNVFYLKVDIPIGKKKAEAVRAENEKFKK